jgi:hypothetical protein
MQSAHTFFPILSLLQGNAPACPHYENTMERLSFELKNKGHSQREVTDMCKTAHYFHTAAVYANYKKANHINIYSTYMKDGTFATLRYNGPIKIEDDLDRPELKISQECVHSLIQTLTHFSNPLHIHKPIYKSLRDPTKTKTRIILTDPKHHRANLNLTHDTTGGWILIVTDY